jgi:uncharacterized repeat protein (TIGR03837 family)
VHSREAIRGAAPAIGRWDLFCRVVDNYGDAGFCWRLARQLAVEHGIPVRLWIDDPPTLAALRPGAAAGVTLEGVQIEHWREDDPRLAAPTPADIADVVVGALDCRLPDGYRAAMRARRPVWVALDYLSAEDWVPTHHGLPSPKSDGLVEHFFFPGFGADTGGLLRESDLLARRDAFEADPGARAAFLASLGVHAAPDARLVSLFCYPDTPADVLLDGLAAADPAWRVLVPAGTAPAAAAHPIALPVPFVAQPDYDRLLWCCEINFVRGEESFVRSLWAARPMIWQAYRQAEGVHRLKIDAFLRAWSADACPEPRAAAALADMTSAWNADPEQWRAGVSAALPPLLDALPALRRAAASWSAAQAGRPDLARRLMSFVADRL